MYVDSTIFMHAMGAASRFKEPCARILRAGAADTAVLVTSAETLQEVLHRYRSIGRSEEIKPAFEAISVPVQRILPVSAEDVEEARQFGQRIPAGRAVSARDLVHAAVARRQGSREVLTVDAGFASIPGVALVDPLAWTE